MRAAAALLLWAGLAAGREGVRPPRRWCGGYEPTRHSMTMATLHGRDFTVPYYSSAGDIFAAGRRFDGVEFALTSHHGMGLNADEYFCAGFDAARAQHFFPPEKVIVLAPGFKQVHRDPHQPSDPDPPTATELAWSYEAWRFGGDSDPDGGRRPGDVASYAVIDALLLRLNDKAVFPHLRGVSLFGHSAGGQVLTRYALTTALPASLLEATRFIPSNPSSNPYLDARRYNYTCGGAPPCRLGHLAVPPADVVAACPGYNDWGFGLAGALPPYVARGVASGVERFPSADVVYLQGDDDRCNEDGTCWTEQCPSSGLDRTCDAMQQGPERRWRGRQYTQHLRAHYGRDIHRLIEVPGVGHSGYGMINSPLGIDAAFAGWGAAANGTAPRPPLVRGAGSLLSDSGEGAAPPGSTSPGWGLRCRM